MSDYRPVDCACYDRLELAILRGRALRLAWLDPAGVAHVARVIPLDLLTRDGEEFLVFGDGTSGRHRVRLDRILEAE